MLRRTLLAVGAGGLLPQEAAAQGAPSAGPPSKRRFVLFHTPGPIWDHDKDFQDQTGIEGHVGYLYGLFEQGRLVMGGPFLDNSGGMAILNVGSLEEAHAIGENDPTVKGALLNVEVKPWLAVFSPA